MSRSAIAISQQFKYHLNKGKKPMEEIIDMFASGESFLIPFGMAFLDIHTRWIAGFGMGAHRNRALAIYCLDQLQNNLACLDRRLSDILIHHDRDSVYTSYDWLHRVLIREGVGISFAMNGAKDNPWIESFWDVSKPKTKL